MILKKISPRISNIPNNLQLQNIDKKNFYIYEYTSIPVHCKTKSMDTMPYDYINIFKIG